MDCREISQEELNQIIQERDALRAQVATLSAGKVWIPEPSDDDLRQVVYDVGGDSENDFERALVHNGYRWAREHAVAPVVAPELPSDGEWEACESADHEFLLCRKADPGIAVAAIFAVGEHPSPYVDEIVGALNMKERPIPADRILQDGERAVDSRRFDRMLADESERPYLLELELYVRTMARLQNWSRDTTDHGPLNQLDNLRAKKEGGQE